MVILDEQLLDFLRTIVEEAWHSLPRDQRISKEEMARRVLDAAEYGERDPEKLRQIACGAETGARNSVTPIDYFQSAVGD